jgi:ABC-type lipoprotein export system ATPase subunit
MIEAVEISFGYRRGAPILERWSALIGAGEIVSITGPSGSGKSTLLYLLGTLVRPWSGSLHVAGIDVASLGDTARSDVRSAIIGFVFQDALLDPRRSVIENVVEGAVYRGSNRRDALDLARILLERVEVAVEPGRAATDLSGGQAQRVALCRALLNQPAIILADEPTGNLDETNAAAVESVLFERARAGSTIVIATHDEVLAAKCDRTYRL